MRFCPKELGVGMPPIDWLLLAVALFPPNAILSADCKSLGYPFCVTACLFDPNMLNSWLKESWNESCKTFPYDVGSTGLANIAVCILCLGSAIMLDVEVNCFCCGISTTAF